MTGPVRYGYGAITSGGTSDATKVDKFTTQAKTASFTAAPWLFYLVDTTGGAVTATLPAANVAGQQLAIKLNAGTTAVTVVPAGTDTIGAAATTASITLASEVWEFISSGSGQWNLVAGNKSLASLDGRYPLRANDLSDLNSAATARTNLGLGGSATRAVGTGTGTVLSADTVDAKGDLLAGTANDTIARLAVGSNGQFLTADSSTASGLAWGPGAVPRRPALAASWATITNRPLVVPATGTGTLAKDSWRFLPIRLTEDLPIDALAVTTVTTAASGGTAALIFGLFALGADNRPGSRQADYSSYGSIDLTQAVGILQLATVGLTIPMGEWYLGLGWSGTATVSPIMQTVTGHHPAISNVTATTIASAYLQAVSAATVPTSASVSTTASVAPLVHGKLR